MNIRRKIIDLAAMALPPSRQRIPLTEGLAHDIGLSRNELVEFASRGSEVAPRMERMARLFGIGDTAALFERWRNYDMVQACAACPHKRRCDQLLHSGNARPDEAGFCPNSDHYRTVATRAA